MATNSCFFKQIDEKHVNLEVRQMLWNPKMDLIALGFSNGDVHLYRLSWQKVWNVNTPQQNAAITSMVWRPDGKILAVAYTNGYLRLYGVEDAKKIFSYNSSEAITCLNWLQEDANLAAKHEMNNFYEDLSATLLPKPITYDLLYNLFEKSNNREFPDNLFIKDTKNLTYLLCTHGTSIAIFVYGYFLLVDTNLDLLANHIAAYKSLKSCYLSDNCTLINAIGVTDEEQQQSSSLVYSLIDASILSNNHLQIKLISTKFGMLFSMLTALKTVIKEMEELWEDILVEMDQKFQVYANEKYNNRHRTQTDESIVVTKQPDTATVTSSSLVHDFIQLYAFGSCSDQFKTFLIHELTEKGLKKLEASVENYYSNIQRLLCGSFHQITLCIFYHLNELYGMTKWFDKFKIFSLTEQRVEDVLNNCASLILKAQELNFVVEQNMKEIKLFFKWLHSSIIHLTDDQAVTEMLNEEMENLILNFINYTFKDDQTINLEKVGQYLKNDNLRILVNEDNDWQAFVRQKLDQKDQQYLYPLKREKSLIGCFEEFKHSLNDCFKCQAISMIQPFRLVKQHTIHRFPQIVKDANDVQVSFKCFEDAMITGVVVDKLSMDCYVIKHTISKDTSVKALIINLAMPNTDIPRICFQDVYVYNETSVTLLATDNKNHSNTYMVQLTFDDNNFQSSTDSFEKFKITKPLNDSSCSTKHMANTRSVSLVASNTRRVAALLSTSRRRVRLFELENEDEDECQNEDNNEEHNNQENDVIEEENISMKNEDQVPLANIENNEQTNIHRINKRKKNFDEEEDDEQQQPTTQSLPTYATTGPNDSQMDI